MATTSKTPRKTTTSSIAERVAALREIAEHDPLASQEFAWAWFEHLGKLVERDRAVLDDLDELFACGRPSRGIDGPTEGIALWFHINRVLDAFLNVMLAVHNPWIGKRFNAAQQTGDNLATTGGRWLLKLIWPSFRIHSEDGRWVGGDFQTRVEAGAIEPRVDVLVIDYAPVETNPAYARRVRDELVEIVPGAHFGRALLLEGDKYRNTTYFALRSSLK
jgi:hypothetical protein